LLFECFCVSGLFFCQCFFHQISRNNFFLECIGAGLFGLHRADDFCKALSVGLLQRSNYFLCHGYLISLWTVTFLRIGLYFLSSSRSVVFFRFLVVIYRLMPGMPDALCSVHSMIT